MIKKSDLVIPQRKKDAHKGQSGRCMIAGGSEDYAGALYLAGIAALRAGCDYVTIFAPEKVAWAVNSLSADLVTIKLPGANLGLKHLRKLSLEGYDCLLIGTGIGKRSDPFIRNLRSDIPKVIDGEAIGAVPIQKLRSSLLTPHTGELRRLLKASGLSNVEQLQAKLGDNVILAKGPKDMIMTRDRIVYNGTGNPGMAKAGTGDVLAGLCAGFAAQGLSLLQSAINASYINGKAGDILKSRYGYRFIASDLLDAVKVVV